MKADFDLAKITKDERHKSISIFNRILTRTVIPYMVRVFHYFGITPMQITVGRIIFLPFSYYYFLTDSFFLSGLLFLSHWILDHTDGALARATNKTSNLGAFVDNVIDISATTIFLGLIIIKHDTIMGALAMCTIAMGFILLYLKLAYVSQIGTRPEMYYRLLKHKIDLTLFFGGDAHVFWLCIGLMSSLLNLYLFYLILAGLLENANMVLMSIKQISSSENQGEERK